MKNLLVEMTTTLSNFSQRQLNRLARFSVESSVDIHCHCLPGVDDGPASLPESVQLCRMLVEDGITIVIATPHQLGAYEGANSGSMILQAVSQLQDALVAEHIPLTVLPGADVRVDLRLIELLNSGEILTLAQGPYLLLELPTSTLIDLRRPIALLTEKNISTILSHPERHPQIVKNPDVLFPWLEAGAILQVTAGSLLGQFGTAAENLGWQLIAAGLVALVATDAHNIDDRPPVMTAAITAISARVGHTLARRICLENPLRVLRGEPINPPSHFRSLKPARARRWGL